MRAAFVLATIFLTTSDHWVIVLFHVPPQYHLAVMLPCYVLIGILANRFWQLAERHMIRRLAQPTTISTIDLIPHEIEMPESPQDSPQQG